jgi:HCOMODA/2-hydroxy-3-carboxy-muconic semialdehyde decarboxylase
VSEAGIQSDQARRVRQAARAAARAGLVHAYGHCSLRLDATRFIVSPPKPLGLVTANDAPVMVKTTGPLPPGALPEVIVHQRIYEQRAEVAGILRFHSPQISALSALARTPRALHGFGAYFAPQPPLYSNPRLVRDPASAAALVSQLGAARGIVMRGNGAVTVGTSIEEAVVMAWYLEDAARLELAVLNTGLPAFELTAAEAADRAGSSGSLVERMWDWLTCNDREIDAESGRGIP